jgi:hypothetical protein
MIGSGRRDSKMRPSQPKALVVAMACVLLGLMFWQRHVLACVFVASQDFDEIARDVHAHDSVAQPDRDALLDHLPLARSRIASVFGDAIAAPRIILVATEAQAARFGVFPPVPGKPYSIPGATYIVLTPDGNNVDVVAHELVHAEIAHRLGYLDYSLSLPVWFNEGAAMQVDLRKKQSWRYIEDGVPLPAVSSIASGRTFFSGDQPLHYAAAKVELAAWLEQSTTKGGLYAFLADYAEAESFDDLYQGYAAARSK